jgi:hypothetical protein
VSTSPNIRAALDEIKRLRDEFREIRLNYYVKAETATNGRILGRRGIRAKVDPQELLTRNMVSIRAYGSPELLEWIAENPRMTFAQYEEQMFEAEHELYEETIEGEDLYPYDAYDPKPIEEEDPEEFVPIGIATAENPEGWRIVPRPTILAVREHLDRVYRGESLDRVYRGES